MTTTTKTTHPKAHRATAHTTEEEITVKQKPKTKTKIKTKTKTVHTHPTNQETTMNPSVTNAASTNPNAMNQETTMNASITNAASTITIAASNANATISPVEMISALVAQLSGALDAAEAQFGADAPAITAMQKKRTGKPRKGSDKVLTKLAPIVDQFKLNSDSLNTTQMLARYNLAQTLLPLQARLQKMTKRVDDEVFSAQTGSWEMGLQFYSLLQRRAKSDGNIATSIEPLVKVFSYRHPEAGKQSKVTTRIKAKLRSALAIANKHGVAVTVAPNGGVQSIAGAPAAVAAAQAELATQGATVAPAAAQGAAAPSPGSTASSGAAAVTPAAQATPAPVMSAVNGAPAVAAH